MSIRNELQGKRFGQWKVTGPGQTVLLKNKPYWYYPCRCSCGTRQLVQRAALMHKLSTKCKACASSRSLPAIFRKAINVAKEAKRLGISPQALYVRLKKWPRDVALQTPRMA